MARHGTRSNRQRHPRRPGGFTLIELLVVISIVILVSAVTLPTLIPALQNRQVNEGARILQGALAGARDAAIRANAPRGIRLLSDPALNGTCNRILTIETAPDHSDGLVMLPAQPITSAGGYAPLPWVFTTGNMPRFPFPLPAGSTLLYPPYSYPPINNANGQPYGVLMVMQSVFTSTPVYSSSPVPNVSWTSVPIPATPTNWFWNIRIGDKIRFNDSGAYYTIIGPMTQYNPELFVNDYNPNYPNGGATIPGYGNPSSTLQVTYPGWPSGRVTVQPEYLILVNGIDDNNNGYIDEGVDGLDEGLYLDASNNPIIDDVREITLGVTLDSTKTFLVPEPEAWLGTQLQQASAAVPPALPYTIVRRPVPTQGAREVSLPAACVVDLTTWNTTRERSRLPVDSMTGTVDILLNQRGQVVPTTVYSSPSAFAMDSAFFHFWVADRTDVYAPTTASLIANNPYTKSPPTLPMPVFSGILYPWVNPATGLQVGADPAQFNPGLSNIFLKRERQLVTLYTRTGQVVTNSIENFDAADLNKPYHDAQLGIREAK